MSRTPLTGMPLPMLASLAGVVFVALVVAIAFASGLISLGPSGPPISSPTPTAVAQPGSTPLPSAALSPVPSPIGQPSPSPGPSPSAQPTGTPTSSPTAFPTASPLPTPTQTDPAPSPTRPPSRFVAVQGFPAPGERVTEIVATDSGFVAVGYSDNPTDECPYRVDGRIWTSADGERWTRRDGGEFADTNLWGVVDAGSELFAFGYVGVPGDCPVPEGFGNNVWRSVDGVSWQQITSGIASENDRWNDIAVAGDTLVVVGHFGESGDDESRGGGVWTSSNGVDWQAASRSPDTFELVEVAALGSTVVAFGEDPSDGLAWYSTDTGDTWSAGKVNSGFAHYSFDLVAAHGRFVAVTSACCELPMTTVGVALSSTDGRTWSSATEAHRDIGEKVVVMPGSFLTLTHAGETRLSTDGMNWRSGPRAPSLDPFGSFISAAGSGAAGVVMVTYDLLPSGVRESAAWFAPLGDFNPGAWTEPAAPAAKPVIGEAYRYLLYTHCGEENTRVAFDGSIWVIDEIEARGRGFANPEDRGTITMLDQERARYRSRRGGSILLERTATPPPWPRCA